MNVGQIESGFCPSADGKAAEALKGMLATAAPAATEAGDIFRQPDLAELLKKISYNGIEEFYEGSIAKIIDADMRENGGLLRYDDLALIPWPIIPPPLKRKFRGATVYTMPLPAAGRTLLFTLLMLDHLPLDTSRDIASEDELSGETTHLSTMDNKGMAVSLTRSIERVYSSKAAAAGMKGLKIPWNYILKQSNPRWRK